MYLLDLLPYYLNPQSKIYSKVYLGDCLDILPKIPSESIDLVFADPPYNMSKKQGLGRIIERKDLAAILSKAYENRLEVNYLGNIETVELDRTRARKFMNEAAAPFIAEADKIISEL